MPLFGQPQPIIEILRRERGYNRPADDPPVHIPVVIHAHHEPAAHALGSVQNWDRVHPTICT